VRICQAPGPKNLSTVRDATTIPSHRQEKSTWIKAFWKKIGAVLISGVAPGFSPPIYGFSDYFRVPTAKTTLYGPTEPVFGVRDRSRFFYRWIVSVCQSPRRVVATESGTSRAHSKMRFGLYAGATMTSRGRSGADRDLSVITTRFHTLNRSARVHGGMSCHLSDFVAAQAGSKGGTSPRFIA